MTSIKTAQMPLKPLEASLTLRPTGELLSHIHCMSFPHAFALQVSIPKQEEGRVEGHGHELGVESEPERPAPQQGPRWPGKQPR